MTDDRNPVIPEGFDDLLASKALAHVATIGPHGEPQSTPVWFIWDGTQLRIGQTEGQQKLKNLRRDPRIALSIVDLANPYRYLEIRGRVVVEEPDPDGAFLRQMSVKYIGDESFQGEAGGVNLVVVIEPVHTTRMTQ